MTNIITDAQAKDILADLPAPRITLEYMESRIRHTEFIYPDVAPGLTICLLTLDNGFHSVGISAPALTQNYNQDVGRKYAKENALRDLWGKFGFALCEKAYASKAGAPLPGIEVPVTPPSGNTPAGSTSDSGQSLAGGSQAPTPLSLAKQV